ncbi:MAG: AAA family ATPase, partial [Candidatus Cloacimonadota bacterium]
FDREDFLSLLFYMGILSIKGRMGSRAILSIPNLVIENLYRKFFIKMIEEKTKISLNVDPLENCLYQLSQKGNINDLVFLCEKTLASLSNRDFLNFDEKYIKAILFSYLSMSNLYFIKSEYEVEKNYVDLVMLERSPFDVNYQFAIELKYIKKSTFEKVKNILQDKTLEAKVQMQNYLQTRELSELSQNKSCPLKSYIFIFVGTKCEICEEIFNL